MEREQGRREQVCDTEDTVYLKVGLRIAYSRLHYHVRNSTIHELWFNCAFCNSQILICPEA